MLDFSLFLSPFIPQTYASGTLGASIDFTATSSEELKRNSICIVHVKEYRNHTCCPEKDIHFRDVLYRLYAQEHWKMSCYDLGDLNAGETIQDTYFALQTLVTALLKINCIPVIVGGSMDLNYAISVGFEATEQLINLCAVDERINLGKPDSPIHSKGYLSSLLLRRPCYLFNHATLGVQPNRNPPDEGKLYEKLYFDMCRLGALTSDLRLAEPHLRNADIVGMNLDAIKASERQIKEGNPNGFTLEQFCRIAKYAGISDKLSCFGIFNPSDGTYDAAIVAHAIWYFIEGFEERKGDFPVGSKKDYLRFTVVLDGEFKEMVFYKSNKTERWWMEVPYPPNDAMKFERHHLVPCDKADYENAMHNEIPDLWWKTYQKLG
jgi:hypothetical protein